MDVVLTALPHGVKLEITDDGRGFVIEDSRGFGLNGTRERLPELGGELTVTSSAGDGTRVLATHGPRTVLPRTDGPDMGARQWRGT